MRGECAPDHRLVWDRTVQRGRRADRAQVARAGERELGWEALLHQREQLAAVQGQCGIGRVLGGAAEREHVPRHRSEQPPSARCIAERAVKESQLRRAFGINPASCVDDLTLGSTPCRIDPSPCVGGSARVPVERNHVDHPVTVKESTLASPRRVLSRVRIGANAQQGTGREVCRHGARDDGARGWRELIGRGNVKSARCSQVAAAEERRLDRSCACDGAAAEPRGHWDGDAPSAEREDEREQ